MELVGDTHGQLLARVFVANRGEIAIRIAKAATALGMGSVGVYAPVDALALHTRFTSRALAIGGTGGESGDPVAAYLDAEALIRAAKEADCDCVHPGYGFLAENAAFAEQCAAAGLVFVGPSPSVLALFGDKVRARSFALSLGVPIVPGSAAPLASPDEALAVARDLGYPVMLKASAVGAACAWWNLPGRWTRRSRAAAARRRPPSATARSSWRR